MHLFSHSNSLPTLLSVLLLTTVTPTLASYTLKDSYTPSNFFSQFDFFTDADPTHGYVDYQSQSAAQAASLISTSNNQIYMGVDSTSIGSGRGRKSVRITSKATYNHALIILDLEHMPGNICGVWPAFWTVGPNWPTNGEIDIIEGVNGQVGNSVALHTGPGCSVGGAGSSGGTSQNSGSAQAIFSGTVKTSNCDVAAAGQATNAGCAITSSDASTYGDGLNSANGGVYATEWTSNAISVWFFPRSSIPNDITSGSPSPSSWGAPIASFGGGSCTIDNSFKDQQIVFDTTFCGDWAGSVWSTDSMCSSKASTCQDYVMNNPAAFKNAYWAVNSLLVYTAGAGSGSSPSSSAAVSPSPSMSGPIVSQTSPISVPVPSGSLTSFPVPPVESDTSPGAIPSKSSTTPIYSNPASVPTTPGGIQPAPTATQTYAPTPIMTTPNPGVPVQPQPTTMTTSSRGGNNWSQSQSNTWSWGGNNNNNGGGNTWSRGGSNNWGGGGPPKALAMAKFAYSGFSPLAAGESPTGDVNTGADAIPSIPEQKQGRGQSQAELDSTPPGAFGVGNGNDVQERSKRSLVAPVVRREEDGEGNGEGNGEVMNAEHLRRHARAHAHAGRVHRRELRERIGGYGYAGMWGGR